VARRLLTDRPVADARVALGKYGEDLACAELARRGYAIVARRFRCRGGELDIVARDGPTLVFVEVKAREGRTYGGAVQAVTTLKQRRIVRLAREYMMRHHIHDVPCRFDVVAVGFDGRVPSIEIYPGAFDAD
jgi:putative endonuclease